MTFAQWRTKFRNAWAPLLGAPDPQVRALAQRVTFGSDRFLRNLNPLDLAQVLTGGGALGIQLAALLGSRP